MLTHLFDIVFVITLALGVPENYQFFCLGSRDIPGDISCVNVTIACEEYESVEPGSDERRLCPASFEAPSISTEQFSTKPAWILVFPTGSLNRYYTSPTNTLTVTIEQTFSEEPVFPAYPPE